MNMMDPAANKRMAGKPIDRRNARRETAYDISEIRFAGRRPPVTCMVHNLSGLGACIEAATTELPKYFILANHAKRLRTVCRITVGAAAIYR